MGGMQSKGTNFKASTSAPLAGIDAKTFNLRLNAPGGMGGSGSSGTQSTMLSLDGTFGPCKPIVMSEAANSRSGRLISVHAK